MKTYPKTSGKDKGASAIVSFLFVAFIIYSMSRRGGGKNGGNGRRHHLLGPSVAILLGSMLGGGFGGGAAGRGWWNWLLVAPQNQIIFLII